MLRARQRCRQRRPFLGACLAKPGDDCDDSAPTVYTGAPELCDGLDNNCNKKVDLSDGLTAGGNTIAIGPSGAARSFPSIAWATDKSVFGIAYRDTSSSPTANLYFEEVGNAGTVVLEPEELNDAATRGISGPDLAWGGGSFGVAWTADTQGAYLRTFGSNGTLTMAAHHLELSKAPVGFTAGALYSPAVARTSNGDWEVMYYATYDTEGSGYVSGHTITSSGVVGTAVGVPYSSYAVPSLSLAAVGANFVTSITDGSGSAALRNSAFSSIKSLTVQGSVGSGGNGFAMADRAASGAELPKFYAFTSDGTVQCGPVPFADKSFKPEDIVATANGYLVVSSGAVRVQEVFADCSLGALFTVDPGPASNVRIAGGSAGYGLVWQDSAANIPKRRLLGPRYCD